MKRSPEEYTRLITQFHFHREKFNATVRALSSAPVQIGDSARAVPEAFDLDTAIGVQLDVVGQWVGRDRFVPYPMDNFWFSFDDLLRGFDLGVWKGPYETDYGSYRLADEDYRRLLYAKIETNYWDGTFERAEEILLSYYADPDLSPGSLFFLDDRHDTSVTFAVAGKMPPPLILAQLAWNVVPIKVGGGQMRVSITSIDDTPLFGFDMSNDHVSGFDSGSFGVPPLYLYNRGEPGRMDFSDPDNSGLIPAAT